MKSIKNIETIIKLNRNIIFLAIIIILIIYLYQTNYNKLEGFKTDIVLSRPFLHIYDSNHKKTNIVYIFQNLEIELCHKINNKLQKRYTEDLIR